MSKTAPTLADFVRRTRVDKRLSCGDVEKQSARHGPKIAASYVNRIENGVKVKPSADRLQALARGLGVPIEELLAAMSGHSLSDADKADEQMLVTMFRELPREKRGDFLKMLEALHGSQGPRKRKTA